MPLSAVIAGTPYYVLLDGDHRIGPKVVPLPTGIDGSHIYGFSGKGPYDTFCENSPLDLTPYPLVKVYLQEQADMPGEGVQLVVIDATGPSESCVHAATMREVLQAHETRTNRVTTSHQLTFDPEAEAYRLEP